MNNKLYSKISIVLLSLGLILTCGPLVFMLITAFTSQEALSSTPPRYNDFSLENFKMLLGAGHILRWSLNSFLVAGSITLAQTFFNSLAAFGLFPRPAE